MKITNLKSTDNPKKNRKMIFHACLQFVLHKRGQSHGKFNAVTGLRRKDNSRLVISFNFCKEEIFLFLDFDLF